MAKLTDKQRKKIVADYVECQNYSAVAKKHSVSWTTVKNVINAEPSALIKLEHKKEQNTKSIMDYLDSKVESVRLLGDYILDNRLNPTKNKEQMDALPVRDLINAYGVSVDKMLKVQELRLKTRTDEQIEKINENMQSLAELIKSPAPNRKIE